MKTRVRVGARPFGDLTDRRRAGEAWPRGGSRDVVILDQDEDPPGRQREGEFAIGRKTFEILRADPELQIVVVA